MVMPTDRIQQMLARGQQQGTGQQGGGIFSQIDQTLMRPGGSFLLNLLAQEGRTIMAPGQTIPGPLGAIGRAGLMTQQQQQQAQQQELQRMLMERRLGLDERRVDIMEERANQPQAPQRRVQSTQILANGNIGYVDAFTGEVVDTGTKAGNRAQMVDIEGRGRFVFDPVTQSLEPVASEDTIREGVGGRAREQSFQQSAGTAEAQAAAAAPQTVASADQFIDEAERIMGQLESGELRTGPGLGLLPPVTTEAQLFDVFAGENIIDSISRATFGQLSEGERKFIATTTISRNKTPEANMQLLRRKIDILKRARAAAQRAAEQGDIPVEDLSTPNDQRVEEDKPISEMTDAELEAIISGGNP